MILWMKIGRFRSIFIHTECKMPTALAVEQESWVSPMAQE
jgi:hypothetical protein